VGWIFRLTRIPVQTGWMRGASGRDLSAGDPRPRHGLSSGTAIAPLSINASAHACWRTPRSRLGGPGSDRSAWPECIDLVPRAGRPLCSHPTTLRNGETSLRPETREPTGPVAEASCCRKSTPVRVTEPRQRRRGPHPAVDHACRRRRHWIINGASVIAARLNGRPVFHHRRAVPTRRGANPGRLLSSSSRQATPGLVS